MKAIALLSGGLDSILAIKLVKDQGIEVLALNATSPFCTCTAKSSGCSAAASAAKQLDVPLRVFAKGLDYIKIVESPKFGYGRAMNPCIDCRVYLLRKARQIMEEEGASFIISGEVVGQRPMSQKKHTLVCIEREAGVEDILLRPLSASILKPTLPERMGWIDRKKLKGISGRGRKPQFGLAEESGIADYPCPAGGCLLTDKNTARKLQDLFRYKKDYTLDDVRLIRTGRHFRVSETCKAILSRNADEAGKLEQFFKPEQDLHIESLWPKGPSALVKDSSDTGETLLRLIHHYSDAMDGAPLRLKLTGTVDSEITVDCGLPESEIAEMRL